MFAAIPARRGVSAMARIVYRRSGHALPVEWRTYAESDTRCCRRTALDKAKETVTSTITGRMVCFHWTGIGRRGGKSVTAFIEHFERAESDH